MKLSKEERARREGMAYALKVAKEKGVDGLEEEMKRRGVSIASCILPEKELDEFVMKVKENATGTVMAMAEYVLRNKFDYGRKRMERFKFHMNDLADSILKDYLTVDDICQNLKEETGIELYFKENKYDVKVN